MQPGQLTDASFAGYPPQARALAHEHLALLRDLPVVLLAILLRELMAYDWKLPAERRALLRQLRFLTSVSGVDRARVLGGFGALPISHDVSSVDWVNHPSSFIERLTAWLWSTQRMDGFRQTADAYAASVSASAPEEAPGMPRLGLVVIGAGVEHTGRPLFRKLRPEGLSLTRVIPDGGLAALREAASRRAASGPGSFLHWAIDGGALAGTAHLTQVSYEALQKPRARLLELIQKAIATGEMGPEELRSVLARTQPADIGLGGEDALSHFQLSLLTEGAGAQIFATTFVQWAARECARRAEPETMLVRYTPRQQAQTMNAMLSGAPVLGVDVDGSLTDADMGAYYTWLNLRRLSGAEQMRFLVWFEGHAEAVAIGPGLPRGTTSDSPMKMDKVLALLG